MNSSRKPLKVTSLVWQCCAEKRKGLHFNSPADDNIVALLPVSGADARFGHGDRLGDVDVLILRRWWIDLDLRLLLLLR